jgi:hypothetical protein
MPGRILAQLITYAEAILAPHRKAEVVALVDSLVSRVVAASNDDNPLVLGRQRAPISSHRGITVHAALLLPQILSQAFIRLPVRDVAVSVNSYASRGNLSFDIWQ